MYLMGAEHVEATLHPHGCAYACGCGCVCVRVCACVVLCVYVCVRVCVVRVGVVPRRGKRTRRTIRMGGGKKRKRDRDVWSTNKSPRDHHGFLRPRERESFPYRTLVSVLPAVLGSAPGGDCRVHQILVCIPRTHQPLFLSLPGREVPVNVCVRVWGVRG